MSIFDFFKKKESEHPRKEVNTVIIQEKAAGTSGTEMFAGYLDEEYLEKLKGMDRAKEFDKMTRSDSQVKMLMSAVKNPIRSATKEIIPAVADDVEYEKHAALCKQVFFTDIKFNKLFNESLTVVKYGHAVFERVNKVHLDKPILDDDGNVILSSYIGLKKLAWRSPKTIETWNINKEKESENYNELKSITQQADGDLDSYVDMPIETLMVMAIDQEGDDFEGVSMLRPCYGNYFRKNDYLKKNSIGIEKSMPMPTAEIPPGKENTEQYTNLINTLESFTSHQQNYLTYPTGWNIQLSNGTNYDPSKIEKSIDNEDKRMAKAFLANFLELGMGGGGGAFALSNDLSDFFLSGLIYIANIIKEAYDEELKKLVIINFGEQSKYPEFKFSGIQDKAGEEFAKIIDLLVKNRVIIPDDNLEDHVRTRIGVSPKSEDGKRDVEPEKQEVPGLTLSEKVKFAIKEKRKLLGGE